MSNGLGPNASLPNGADPPVSSSGGVASPTTVASGPVGSFPVAASLPGGSITVTGSPVSPTVAYVAYAGFTLTAAGGASPYTFALSSGSLPPGLSLSGATSTTVNISGTPTSLGSYTFVISATDSASNVGYSNPITIQVIAPTVVVSGSTPTTPAVKGVAYPSDTLTASGGTSPYTFAVTSGSLPSGLSLTGATSTTVNISGTPTSYGLSSGIVITATDANGFTGTFPAFSINVTAYAPPVHSAVNFVFSGSYTPPAHNAVNFVFGGSSIVVSGTLPSPESIGQSISQTFTASGGTGPYTWSASGLPSGLSINSSTGIVSGTVSGSPTTYSVIITATDTLSATGTLPITVVVVNGVQPAINQRLRRYKALYLEEDEDELPRRRKVYITKTISAIRPITFTTA